MRYFFDLVDDTGLTFDEEGVELATVADVQTEAARALAEAARDAAEEPGATQTMEIPSEASRGLCCRPNLPSKCVVDIVLAGDGTKVYLGRVPFLAGSTDDE
jgi:hypothetical protein